MSWARLRIGDALKGHQAELVSSPDGLHNPSVGKAQTNEEAGPGSLVIQLKDKGWPIPNTESNVLESFVVESSSDDEGSDSEWSGDAVRLEFDTGDASILIPQALPVKSLLVGVCLVSPEDLRDLQ